MKKYSKYLITLAILIAAITSVCFIPIGISRFIPVIEKQVAEEYGIEVHIEKLVMRIGPSLKVKTPIMHVMYSDGQKFAQFDNVKFSIPWISVFKNKPLVKKIYAKKINVRLNSDDKYLPELIEVFKNKPYNETPDIKFNEYIISFINKGNGDKYSFEGHGFETKKLLKYKNYSLNTIGNFNINNKKYIGYDLNIVPKINIDSIKNSANLPEMIDAINRIKNLDFHTDINADLKLLKLQEAPLSVSGVINIDNIYIFDANGNSPRSFIYLTFLGDKANILSNIYTSNDKKICIDGFVNSSDKPTVDLKVKADEIKLNEIYNKVKIITDFSELKNISSIDGILNANFSLKGDLNKIKSNGFMKVSKGKICAAGVDIDKIDADIDFSNNVVNIKNAVGYVNNSPITARGTISKNINLDMVMDKVELKHFIPAKYGVKNGILSMAAKVSGTLDNIVHKENIKIDNFAADFDKNTISFLSFRMDTNKDNAAYVSNILFDNNYTNQVKIPSLKFFIEQDSIKVPDTSIFMANSKLTAKSDILNYSSTNNLAFNFSLKGFINSKDINALKTQSGKYPVALIFNGNKNVQNINGQVLIEQTTVLDEPAILNLSSKIEKNSLKVEDLSIVSFNGKLSDDFKSNLRGAKRAVLSGAVENINEPIFKNFRVSVPQQLCIHIADTIAQIKGDLFLNGKYDNPDIVGQLSIINLVNQGTQLSLSNAVADFNKNIVSFNAPLVKIGDSAFGINSSLSSDFKNGILIKNMSIKSKYLNADTLLMYTDNPLYKKIPVTVQDGKFYTERLALTIYGAPLYLSQFNSEVSLNNDVLRFKNLSAEAYNGKIAGELEFNIKDEHFVSKLMGRGVSAAPMLALVTPRKESISGTMDFDESLKGSLSSKNTLDGDVKFIINNGRMSTLGKLEHLLYAQNVIADNMLRTSLSVVTKAITLKDTGLFKYLKGHVLLSNGAANIKMIQTQGPLMALFIKGVYYPETDYAKLLVLGRLSDEVISGLGPFGDFSMNKLMLILTGEETKQNILPEEFNSIPQLPMKNTKEFKTVINGIIDKPSSVISFNWISYSQKSLRQKEVPMTNVKIPEFVDEMQY